MIGDLSGQSVMDPGSIIERTRRKMIKGHSFVVACSFRSTRDHLGSIDDDIVWGLNL